ncbi:unnamed protein product, partial [Tuber aestivum]
AIHDERLRQTSFKNNILSNAVASLTSPPPPALANKSALTARNAGASRSTMMGSVNP